MDTMTSNVKFLQGENQELEEIISRLENMQGLDAGMSDPLEQQREFEEEEEEVRSCEATGLEYITLYICRYRGLAFARSQF